jgi:hypothetical protein
VVITALYPVVTVVLAMTLLREAISWRQFLAVILAIVAIVLIATEPAHRAGAVSPTPQAAPPCRYRRRPASILLCVGKRYGIERVVANRASASMDQALTGGVAVSVAVRFKRR